MKIRQVGAELFHADGQTDRRDEANSRFSKSCERAYKETDGSESLGQVLVVSFQQLFTLRSSWFRQRVSWRLGTNISAQHRPFCLRLQRESRNFFMYESCTLL